MSLKIRKDGAWVRISSKESGSITATANGSISVGDPVLLNSDGTVSKIGLIDLDPIVLSGPTNPYNGSNSHYNDDTWTNLNSSTSQIYVICIGGGGGGGGPEDLYGGGGAGLGTATINVSLNDEFSYQAGAGGKGGYNRLEEDGPVVNQIGYDGGDTWLKNSSGTILVMGEGGEGGSETSGNGGGYTVETSTSNVVSGGGGHGGDGGYQGYTAYNNLDCAPGGGGAGGYNGKGGDGGNTPYSTNNNGRIGEDAASGSGGGGGGGGEDYDQFFNRGAGGGGGGTGDGGIENDGEGGFWGEEGGYGGEGGSSGQDGFRGGLAGTSPSYTGTNQGGYGGYYGGGGGKACGPRWNEQEESRNGGYGGRGRIVITPTGSNLTSSNFIGFSQGNYTNNDTVTINIIASIDTNQSGLTTGKTYYVQKNGTLSITPDDPSVEAGFALSSTTISVK